MATKLKKFRVYAPPDVKSYGLNENGTLTITGIASTTNRDLDGDIVTPEALESLARQVVGLNLHLDHNHHYDGGIGVITDAELLESSLRITAVILPEYAKGIQERLELGMNFGFSIGGLPITSSMDHNQINDFLLLEMSLTLLPANWDTFGTVESKGIVKSKCLTGACHYILKEFKNEDLSDKMQSKEKPLEISEDIKQELVDIVNEAVYNLKPQILEELKGEISTIVENVVTQIVPDALPVDKEVDEEISEEPEEEIVENDEEIVEEEKEAEVPVNDEEVADEVETKSEDDAEIEELEQTIAEEAAAADSEDTEVVKEESEAETEEVVEEEKDITGVEEEAEVEYVESGSAPKVIVDVKSLTEDLAKEIASSLDLKELTAEITKDVEERVFKNLNKQRKVKKSPSDSKLKQYQKEVKKPTKTKFLGGKKRDEMGRNRKFL